MIFRLGLPSPKEVNNMATREFLFHSTMEEGSIEARRKSRHRGGTEDKSRAFLLLLTSASSWSTLGLSRKEQVSPFQLLEYQTDVRRCRFDKPSSLLHWYIADTSALAT